jgi:hypothetical protein
MADNETPFDPFGEVVNLVAVPIAAAIRSVEQFRHAADEFMRGVENFNATMENLNETAARVNAMLNELEEPVRVLIPQVTRTVKTADEISQKVAALPVDPAEFMRAMMDLSARLAPLAQMAESASGMFGLRLPGFGRAAPVTEPEPAPPPAPAKKAATKSSTAKKATAKKSTAKKSTSSRR